MIGTSRARLATWVAALVASEPARVTVRPTDHGRGDEWIPRALELGLVRRDDGILVEAPLLAYKNAAKAQRFSPRPMTPRSARSPR